jgi:hypothetical protein
VHACRQWQNLGVIRGVEHNWCDVIEILRAGAVDEDGYPDDYQVEIIDEAERLVGSYVAHYGAANAGWPADVTVMAAEQHYEDRVLQHTGRADALLKVFDRVVISDTKTRSSMFPRDSCYSRHDPPTYADFAKAASTSPQFLFLTIAVRRAMNLDYYPQMWIDGIIKTKIPKFQRVMVDFAEHIVEDWLAHQHRKVLLPIADEPNFFSCAPVFGSRCGYFDWCHGAPELRDDKYERVEP